MNKKIIVILSITILQAIYNTIVKLLDGRFPVNMAIFWFCFIYGYIVFTIFYNRIKPTKREKNLLYILSIPWVVGILVNISAIGMNYSDYVLRTSNYTIDSAIYLVVISSLIYWRYGK